MNIQHANKDQNATTGVIMFFTADEEDLVGERVGFVGKNFSKIVSIYDVGDIDGADVELGVRVGLRLIVSSLVGGRLVGLAVPSNVGVVVGGGLFGWNVYLSDGFNVGCGVRTVGLIVEAVGRVVGLFVFGFGLGIALGLLVGDSVKTE